MRRATIIVLLAVGMLAAYLLFWPIPIDPVRWEPSPHPGMTGVFAPNERLSRVRHVARNIGQGPEDVAKGPDGLFYTGLQDGRIVRFRLEEDGERSETFVTTGGRPLGMQFDARGNLVVADAFKGLLSIAPDGRISVLVNAIDGKRIRFADDLDIAGDGTIWFSDASQRFDQHHWILDFWECRPTGRLLSYSPATGRATVHLDGLMFANGVALGPNEEYVLVNETISSRITRLWLRGPNAGRHDVFMNGLPAYPDNLSYNRRGVFWVALPAARVEALDRFAPRPFLRKVLFRLPEALTQARAGPALGWVIGVDEHGRVVHSLQDSSGRYTNITSVNEFDGHVFLGSLAMTSVGHIVMP